MKRFETEQEAQSIFELAFGRILLMGSRPSQEGDISEYERCKGLILDACEFLGVKPHVDSSPNFVRDYNKIYHD